MKNPKANILVVEDDPAILNGLLDVLVFNGFTAQGVEDGIEGLNQALSGNWDLVLLDVMLPGLDGFSICRAVREKKPSQAIVMLTAKGAEEDVVAGFKAGADDYVSKPFSLRELMVRLEAVLRRSGKNLGEESFSHRGVFFDGPNLCAAHQGEKQELTRREMDIMVHLHRNRERIVSKRDLLRDVWRYPDADIETRTVDIHLLKLRRKLTALCPDFSQDAANPFIRTVRGEGYRLSPEEEDEK